MTSRKWIPTTKIILKLNKAKEYLSKTYKEDKEIEKIIMALDLAIQRLDISLYQE